MACCAWMKSIDVYGHIITGLAIHFAPIRLTRLAPMDRELFNEEFLTRAKIISKFQMKLEDADNRRCYQLRLTALRHGEVPLPKVVENYDDVSEEEEEDVKPQVAHEKAKVNKKDGKAKAKKHNRAPKRKRFEDSIEEVEKKIKDVANRSDKRIGDMIMEVITKFEVYNTLRDARMDNLIAEVQELKQMISQSRGTKASMEPSVKIIVPETSSSNASD